MTPENCLLALKIPVRRWPVVAINIFFSRFWKPLKSTMQCGAQHNTVRCTIQCSVLITLLLLCTTSAQFFRRVGGFNPLPPGDSWPSFHWPPQHPHWFSQKYIKNTLLTPLWFNHKSSTACAQHKTVRCTFTTVQCTQYSAVQSTIQCSVLNKIQCETVRSVRFNLRCLVFSLKIRNWFYIVLFILITILSKLNNYFTWQFIAKTIQAFLC